MQKISLRIAVLSTILFTFSSCEVIGGIFKAGMGFGIFIVVAIIIGLLFLVSKMFGRK